MKLNYFFPFSSDAVLSAIARPAPYYNDPVDLSVQANHELDVLAPVDPVTGNRPNILNKIVDETVDPLEKQRLMGSLQRIPSSSHARMSDADLIATTPSRYNQTLTDEQKFSEHLVNVIESGKENTSPDDGSSSSVAPVSAEPGDTSVTTSDN